MLRFYWLVILSAFSLEPSNMDANKAVMFVYDQLTAQPGILDTTSPTNSLLLTRPTRGYPDSHLDVFPDPTDPSYRLIQAWITQGAPKN